MFHSRTKHIEVDIHYIRDLISKGMVEVRFVPTIEQTTDIFTKAISIERFKYLKNKLAIVLQPEAILRETVKKNEDPCIGSCT